MNTIRLIAPAILALPLVMTSGCMVISSKTETRTYQHAGFDSINASSGINVVLAQGPFSVIAEAPEGKLDRIRIEQNGTELRLSREPELSFGYSGRYLVTVAAPSISKIDVSGGADLDASGLTADTLDLKASGGGDMRLTGLKIGALTASTSGGGDIDAAGSCTSATLDASGGGDFSGRNLDCASASVVAAGGGDVDIRVRDSATGKATAGGDIRFFGNPATFNKDESTGGDITLEAP